MELEELVQKILVMADQHFPFIDERVERIALKYTKDNRRSIKDIVLLGDGVDNPVMSKFPERPDNKSVLQEEIDQYVAHIGKFTKLCPSASVYMIAGNHDKSRLDSTASLNRSMAGLRAVQFNALLKESIAEQRLKFSFKLSDTARLYGINFTHGDSRIDPFLKKGVHQTRRTAETYPYQGDLVRAHTHTVEECPRPLGDSSVYSVGCMADISKLAKQYRASHGYQNGFMIITIDGKNKQFQNIKVGNGAVRIDGKRYN